MSSRRFAAEVMIIVEMSSWKAHLVVYSGQIFYAPMPR